MTVSVSIIYQNPRNWSDLQKIRLTGCNPRKFLVEKKSAKLSYEQICQVYKKIRKTF
jgi:hypothetical protein